MSCLLALTVLSTSSIWARRYSSDRSEWSEVGFESLSALNGRVSESRTISSQGLEERAGVTTILGASALVAGIERSVAPIRSEVRSVPKWHQPEDPSEDAHFAGVMVSLKQMEFLETFEHPEGEIDYDAERIKNLALKLERQSFA